MDRSQCPHCGTLNDSGSALCENCQTPLTAYSGQLSGEAYQGKLAEKVAELRVRPPGVYLMTAFLAVIALAWPVRSIFMAFANRAVLNSESTNYVSAAFGAVGPIMIAIVCVPVAVALLWLAWSGYTQQPGAWQICLGVVGAFAVYMVLNYREYHAWTIFWTLAALGLTSFWIHPSTKAWYGLS